MIKIKVSKDEPIDRALMRLKNKMDTEGIIEDVKAHRYHENARDRKKRKFKTRKDRYSVPWEYTKYETITLDY